MQIEVLRLESCFRLGDRAVNLLLDLIKIKNLKEVAFADCTLGEDELLQIKNLLLGLVRILVQGKY